MLVILHALDAAGKDGTIRHVMSGVNPQGVQGEANARRRIVKHRRVASQPRSARRFGLPLPERPGLIIGVQPAMTPTQSPRPTHA